MRPGTRKPARYLVVTVIATATLILVLTSCPLPIDTAIAARMSDRTLPELVIVSPLSGEEYSQTIDLVLSITDAAGENSGAISAILVTVSTGLSDIVSESIDPQSIDEEGLVNAAIDLATQSFSGPIVVRVTATDWNDNTVQSEITLDDPGNDIPSFTVIPESEHVALYWQAVPAATSYTLYYSKNGTLPSETYGFQIADITETYTEAEPLVIDELINGNLHVFQLRAVGEDESWYSDYVSVIPLSPFTVAPKVHAEYGQLALEWQRIGGTNEFEVNRATSIAGPYTNVSGVVSGYTFLDTDVETGTEYFYRVRPILDDAIESATTAATPSPFPPSASRVVDFVDTAGSAGRLEVVGNYAYVADFTYTLSVVDISDPADLRVVAVVDDPDTTADSSLDLRIEGDYAYVARGGYGMEIIDISNPLAPESVSIIDVPDGPNFVSYDVEVSGDFAYVGYINWGIAVVNISDKANPVEVAGEHITSASFEDLILNDRYLYAVNNLAGGSEFYVYDLQDLGAPDPVYVRTEALDAGSDAQEMTLIADTLLVSRDANPDGGAVEIWDASTASDPVRLGRAETLDDTRAKDAWLDGNVLYLVTDSADDTLTVYDIEDVASPRLLYTVSLPAGAVGLRFAAGHAIVGNRSFGVQAIDASLPPTPDLKNSDNSLTHVGDMELRGDYGFVANDLALEPIFQVLDLSDPSAPAVAASSEELGTGRGIAIRGSYAFVAGAAGLITYSIANPVAPVALGTYETPGNAREVDLVGDFAIVADDGNGVQIVNISDPANPRYSRFVNTGRTYALSVANFHAFVGSTSIPGGVHVIDLTSPLDASRVGLFSGFPAYGVAAGRERVAVASNQDNGMVLIDVRDPRLNEDLSDSDHIASYPPYNDGFGMFPTPEGIAINGTYAFGVDWPEESAPDTGDGLHIFDAFNPIAARRLVDIDVFDTASGVWTYGSRLYIRDWTNGLLVFEM